MCDVKGTDKSGVDLFSTKSLNKMREVGEKPCTFMLKSQIMSIAKYFNQAIFTFLQTKTIF